MERTEYGKWSIFSTEFRKKFRFWRISEKGILADTEISYFDRSDDFKMIGTEIRNHTPWEHPLLGHKCNIKM